MRFEARVCSSGQKNMQEKTASEENEYVAPTLPQRK